MKTTCFMRGMLSANDSLPPIDALVVEDDPVINLHLVDALEREGLRVTEFYCAETALAELRRRSDVRLLVTDFKFRSELDGLALAWKARELHPRIRLIIATGKAREELGGMPEGTVYLGKPFGVGQIRSALSEALGEVDTAIARKAR